MSQGTALMPLGPSGSDAPGPQSPHLFGQSFLAGLSEALAWRALLARCLALEHSTTCVPNLDREVDPWVPTPRVEEDSEGCRPPHCCLLRPHQPGTAKSPGAGELALPLWCVTAVL